MSAKPVGYRVVRGSDLIVRCYRIDEDATEHAILHRVHHSPTGFEFGYGGSGPADLARSILWDWLNLEPSPRMYQDFKWEKLASSKLPAAFVIQRHEIEDFFLQRATIASERAR